MSEPAAWIDITACDAERSRAFYGDLLGWSFTVVDEMNYALCTAGPEDLPGLGTMAVVLDPEGNRVGLWPRPAQKSGSPA